MLHDCVKKLVSACISKMTTLKRDIFTYPCPRETSTSGQYFDNIYPFLGFKVPMFEFWNLEKLYFKFLAVNWSFGVK